MMNMCMYVPKYNKNVVCGVVKKFLEAKFGAKFGAKCTYPKITWCKVIGNVGKKKPRKIRICNLAPISINFFLTFYFSLIFLTSLLLSIVLIRQ